jgi:hypothetical protein
MIMAKQLKICVDRELPKHMRDEANRIAIEENPANLALPASPDEAPRDLELALDARKQWKPGRVLHVHFLNGEPVVQGKVEKIARIWCEYANLQFEFGNNPQAEIRIAFNPGGSWSYVGTDALLIAKGEPTMNLGWLRANTADGEYMRVVLHEFGHALGCIHEHQHPEGGIPWNEKAVLAYYMGPPNNWPENYVRSNVLGRYAKNFTNHTDKLDPHSIMLYPVPKEHTLSGFEIPWRNQQLSEMDKAFIAQVYPK